jgi:hypothetical protein
MQSTRPAAQDGAQSQAQQCNFVVIASIGGSRSVIAAAGSARDCPSMWQQLMHADGLLSNTCGLFARQSL